MPSFFSGTKTPTTSPSLVLENLQNVKKALQITIMVRSMGTASYIGIGGSTSDQNLRLTFIRDFVSIDITPNQKYFDPTELFCISDTSDAVIEIFGQSYQERL
jgi:hypothetical protein